MSDEVESLHLEKSVDISLVILFTPDGQHAYWDDREVFKELVVFNHRVQFVLKVSEALHNRRHFNIYV